MNYFFGKERLLEGLEVGKRPLTGKGLLI